MIGRAATVVRWRGPDGSGACGVDSRVQKTREGEVGSKGDVGLVVRGIDGQGGAGSGRPDADADAGVEDDDVFPARGELIAGSENGRHRDLLFSYLSEEWA